MEERLVYGRKDDDVGGKMELFGVVHTTATAKMSLIKDLSLCWWLSCYSSHAC